MLKKFADLTHRILQAASKGLNRLKFIEYITKTLHNEISSDCLELYLFERGKAYSLGIRKNNINDIYYSEIKADNITNFSYKEFCSNKEIMLKKFFEQLIDSDIDNYNFVYTSDGSFVDYKDKEEHEIPIDHYKYKSYILIPFNIDLENYGIIMIKNYKAGSLSLKVLKYIGGLSFIITDTFVHQYAHDALRERVKEISCLYQVSQIANKSNVETDKILQQIAVILPKAMQYPEIAFARINVDNQIYESDNFQESSMKLAANIYANQILRGYLEVFYSELQIPFHSKIFLDEEKNLITAISEQISFIIERKQIEENNAKLQNLLRHADRLATIGQLSAGIAHEINEPLGTILGFAQLIESNENLDDENQVKKDVKKIIDASMHAREIIRKLMLFSRQMPPKKCSVNLNNLVKDGLYFLENRCQKHGIRIVKDLTENLPDITADPNQIHQVLVNLSVNAIQAMEDGGILSIATEYIDPEYVSLIVKDNGVGMTEQVMNKIFIPFYTTKDINQGTGLGLSVIHGIVSSHGGKISVNSAVNQGTEFTVQLPINGVEKSGSEND